MPGTRIVRAGWTRIGRYGWESAGWTRIGRGLDAGWTPPRYARGGSLAPLARADASGAVLIGRRQVRIGEGRVRGRSTRAPALTAHRGGLRSGVGCALLPSRSGACPLPAPCSPRAVLRSAPHRPPATRGGLALKGGQWGMPPKRGRHAPRPPPLSLCPIGRCFGRGALGLRPRGLIEKISPILY